MCGREVVHEKVFRCCNRIGAYSLLRWGGGLCLEVSQEDEGCVFEFIFYCMHGLHYWWRARVCVAVLDVVDVHECYICALCLESDTVTSALGRDMCMYNGGGERAVNNSDAVCTSYDVCVPWELLVVDVVSSCASVCVGGFL